jgi:uncharacterized protein (TIGR00730 family)
MKRITVFCGSSHGNNAIFTREAFALGQSLAKKKIGVVYGGAQVGLMGEVANGALSEGGEVIGVLPTFLMSKEIAHPALTELILVGSMHERKTRMHALSDGIVALPGGYGTMEEFFEMLTWAQLGLHKKPVALLNTAGFYDPLITLIDTMVTAGFLRQVNRDMILTATSIETMLQQMNRYVPPEVGKWITDENA